MALDNDQGKGLRSLINKIDKDSDWAEFVRLCSDRSGRIQKSEYLIQDQVRKSVVCMFVLTYTFVDICQ